jgi:hypothetical protein
VAHVGGERAPIDSRQDELVGFGRAGGAVIQVHVLYFRKTVQRDEYIYEWPIGELENSQDPIHTTKNKSIQKAQEIGADGSLPR